MWGYPKEATVSKRSTPTFGGKRGLGEIEETQSLVEATHLLNQVGDSWFEQKEGEETKRDREVEGLI